MECQSSPHMSLPQHMSLICEKCGRETTLLFNGLCSVCAESFKREGNPYVCPVCRGTGRVMKGFYACVQSDTFLSAGGTEKCRSCNGTGIVWR